MPRRRATIYDFMDEILDGLYSQVRDSLHQVVRDSGVHIQLPEPKPSQARQKRARTGQKSSKAPADTPDAPTYYDVLEVSPRASQEAITGAYRALARKYHPDRSKGKHAEERMRAINAAYEVLKDSAKRLAYDKELNATRSR